MRFALAACGFAPALALALGLAAPPASRPDDKPKAGNLAQCIHLLTDEAEKSKSDGALVRNAADFAKSFGDPPPEQALLDKILRQVARDAFTDAYVRWQLTSFDPPAFTMTDLAFERLVETLPAFIEHPRAQASLIEAMQKSAAVGALNDKQQAQVNDRLNELAALTSRARSLNVPTNEFRTWLEKRFESEPQRRLRLMIERAAAQAEAGWPVDEVKAEIDAAMTKAARQREFTLEQHQNLIRAAMTRLVKARLYVASAGIAENALTVNYATTGLFDFDVQRWERMLRPAS